MFITCSAPESTTLTVLPTPQPPLGIRHTVLPGGRKETRRRRLPLHQRRGRDAAQRRYAAVRAAAALLPTPQPPHIVQDARLGRGDTPASRCGLPRSGRVRNWLGGCDGGGAEHAAYALLPAPEASGAVGNAVEACWGARTRWSCSVGLKKGAQHGQQQEQVQQQQALVISHIVV
jgi:hypothetical protein